MTDPLDVVKADIEIIEDSLALIVSDFEIGEWPLDQVGVEVAVDGFLLTVDGEEFVFTTPEGAAFAQAVGVKSGRVKAPKRSPRSSRKAHSKSGGLRTKVAAVVTDTSRRPAWVNAIAEEIDFSNRYTKLTAAAVGLFIVLALFARGVLATMLLSSGMIVLVIAGAAIVDPLLAARFPTAWPPIRLVRTGLVALAVGMLLIAF